MTEREFTKYSLRGAYHWEMLSRDPRKHHPFIKARYQICLDLLMPVEGLRVLDYGCGDGALAGLLAKQGAHVTGVDPNQVGLALAQREFSRRKLEGTFVSSPEELPNQFFDRIVCTEVLEHVVDPESILEDIRRLLRPNGIVVITTPIRLSEKVRDVEHEREFYPSEFEALLSKHFSIVETKQVLPVGLQEVMYLSGFTGRVIRWFLRILSAWLGWNYLLRLKGTYSLFAVQVAKLTSRSLA